MSTDHVTRDRNIPMKDLFDGRLEKYGITEYVKEGTTSKKSRCLSDGQHSLWVYGDEFVTIMTRYAGNNFPIKIVNAIEEVFQTEVFTEYEPQFWGYETQEEWDKALEMTAEELEAELYAEIVKYINGEPNSIEARTDAMRMAEIAKELVVGTPDLLDPGSKSDLMKLVTEIYVEKHCATVRLTNNDIPF